MNYYKLFVGNLQWSMTEEELKLLFSQAGEIVSVSIILDRETGRSRGFGFVEMETEIGMQKAIEELDQKTIKGRRILVREAKPETNGEGSGNGIYSKISRFTRTSEIDEKLEFQVDDKHFYIIRDA